MSIMLRKCMQVNNISQEISLFINVRRQLEIKLFDIWRKSVVWRKNKNNKLSRKKKAQKCWKNSDVGKGAL